MQTLLLFKADETVFEPSEVERVFRSDAHFTDLSISAPDGDALECTFLHSGTSVIIDLSDSRRSIALSNTRDAALQAVLIIQQALGIPLRLIDNLYTFDLTFSDIATVGDLEAAMERAKTG